VFRDGGLFEAESVDDITDGALIESEKREYIAAARLGDGVEGVGGGGGTRHGETIHSHMGICQAEKDPVFQAQGNQQLTQTGGDLLGRE